MCISATELLIPCKVQYIYLVLFLNIVASLWDNVVNLRNAHTVIWVSESSAILQIIFNVKILHYEYCVQC